MMMMMIVVVVVLMIRSRTEFHRIDMSCAGNTAVERGLGGSRYKLPRRGGPEGCPEPQFVAYVFVFLGSIRYNWVVICRVDGTCGLRPCCLRRCVLCFPTFYLAVWSFLGGGLKIFTRARSRSRQPCQFQKNAHL